MQPIVFHLADSHMEQGFRAFFRRANWHQAFQCRRFGIDPDSTEDIFRVPGHHDPQLWKFAHENLETHRRTHERAVVILDHSFEGAPPADQLRTEVLANLQGAGWQPDRCEAIVIQPMLEAWLWVENDRVANAFGFKHFKELHAMLCAEGLWDAGQAKPNASQLKVARDLAARCGGRKTGGAVFRGVFKAMSSRAVNCCTEPGFALLRETLRQWFKA